MGSSTATPAPFQSQLPTAATARHAASSDSPPSPPGSPSRLKLSPLVPRVPEATFSKRLGSKLARLIEVGAIGLVRSGYFERCLEDHRPFQSRKDIPSSYMWEGPEAVNLWAKFGKTFLCIISYTWLSQSHPDPNSFHLERIAHILQKLRVLWGMPELAVIMDYCSLFQADPRSAQQKKQKESYNEGLAELNTPYGHRAVTSIKLVDVPEKEEKKYDERGWTLFESIMMDFKAGDFNRFSFEGFDPKKAPEDVVTFFLQFPVKTLRPLLTPDDFQRELQARRARAEARGLQLFSNSKDNTIVPEKYTIAYRRMTQVSILAYDHAGWGDAQVKDLCRALPDCEALEHLQLTGNDIGKPGAQELAKVLPSLKKLRFLAVAGNPLCRDHAARDDLRTAWDDKEMNRPKLGLDADLSPTDLQEAVKLRRRYKSAIETKIECP